MGDSADAGASVKDTACWFHSVMTSPAVAGEDLVIVEWALRAEAQAVLNSGYTATAKATRTLSNTNSFLRLVTLISSSLYLTSIEEGGIQWRKL
jgi:hypothetical protein